MGKDDFVNIIVSVIYYILNGVSLYSREYSNILEGNESDYKSNLLFGLIYLYAKRNCNTFIFMTRLSTYKSDQSIV